MVTIPRARLQRLRKIKRAALGAPPPVNGQGFFPNRLGPKNLQYKFGWIGPAITKLGNTRRWNIAQNPANQIFIEPGKPVETLYNSPHELLAAARLAVAGNAAKIWQQAPWAAADLSLTLTGATVFGVRIRITNSVLNYKFGAVKIGILSGATVLSTITVLSSQLPVDLIALTINDAAGRATVVGVANPIVRFLLADNTALVAGDQLYAESLTARDIGDITGEGAPCS